LTSPGHNLFMLICSCKVKNTKDCEEERLLRIVQASFRQCIGGTGH
jgi:hypothetical protein